MKTSYLDFLLCGGAISALMAGALALVMLLLPLSNALASDYHIIVDFLLALLFYGLLSALVVRLLLRLRPLEPGEYSMDSPVFTYWKLLTIVYRLGQGALLPFTPVFVKPVVEALFGARVGANVALGGTIDDPYMVTIGEGAVLGHASLVSGNMLHGGKLTCGQVRIGAGATVGVNSVILPNSELGENVTLMGGSYVVPGTKIPAGETWRGNPARKWM
jgi:serine acetyltransferase